MIYSFKEFVNESILSKGYEIINRKKIKENDKIANIWFEKITKDYKEKGNHLLASSIYFSDISKKTRFTYKLKKEKFDTSLNPSNEIHLEIDLFNSPTGTSDFSSARLSIKKYEDGIEMLIVGRDMKTRETVYNESGLDEERYFSYINISESLAKKIINFFKSEWEKKYPNIKNQKYYNKEFALKNDMELSIEIEDIYKKSKKEEEEKFEELLKTGEKKLLSKLRFDKSQIKEMMEDSSEVFNTEPKIREAYCFYIGNKRWKGVQLEPLSIIQEYGESYKEMEINQCYYIVEYEIPRISEESFVLGKIKSLKINLPRGLKLVYEGFDSVDSFQLAITTMQTGVKPYKYILKVI